MRFEIARSTTVFHWGQQAVASRPLNCSQVLPIRLGNLAGHLFLPILPLTVIKYRNIDSGVGQRIHWLHEMGVEANMKISYTRLSVYPRQTVTDTCPLRIQLYERQPRDDLLELIGTLNRATVHDRDHHPDSHVWLLQSYTVGQAGDGCGEDHSTPLPDPSNKRKISGHKVENLG